MISKDTLIARRPLRKIGPPRLLDRWPAAMSSPPIIPAFSPSTRQSVLVPSLSDSLLSSHVLTRNPRVSPWSHVSLSLLQYLADHLSTMDERIAVCNGICMGAT